MQRKVVALDKDTVLWEAGDCARTIAVLEKGKLGAQTDDELIGILWRPLRPHPQCDRSGSGGAERAGRAGFGSAG